MDKLELLKITFHKVSLNKDFIAYYLEQAAIMEKRSQDEMIRALDCSKEDFFKLGLCKAPGVNEIDFEERIAKIAEYSNASSPDLSYLLKTVMLHDQIATEQIESKVPANLSLIAKIENALRTFISVKKVSSETPFLPDWAMKLFFGLSKTVLSFTVLILFVYNFTTIGLTRDLNEFYEKGDASYKEAIRGVAVQDKTAVKPLRTKPV